MNDLNRPEGIEQQHIQEKTGFVLRAWPVGLAALGNLLVAALFGVFGVFGAETTVTGAGDGVEVVVEGPVRIRNGEAFEMRLAIATKRDIGDLVLLVDSDIWRNVTVNTAMPGATEEGFRDGSFEFRFGALDAGTRFLVKIDGQVNPSHPPSRNDGIISVADGDTLLATVDYRMNAIP